MLEDLAHQTVNSRVHLHVEITALALGVVDGTVDQSLVSGLSSSLKNERGVGGRVLGLVDVDRCSTRQYASS